MVSHHRIISLPISRIRTSSIITPHSHKNARKALTYYQFQLHLKSPKLESNQSRWKPEGGWIHWAQAKVANTWASFGKAPENNWKLRVFRAGERIVDRIDYEELALKGIDPSLGPTIQNLDIQGKGTQETDEKQKLVISLLYPPSLQSGEVSLEQLRELVQAREPKHRKGFWMWMIVAPFTAPFMIIPVIPNLPFFFCAWRSWSHYKAYRASQYLAALIQHGHVISVPSTELDTIYTRFLNQPVPPPQDSPPLEMLLVREAVPTIISTFSLEDSSASDMYRAIEQARVRSKPST
ncbi:hypothetical protein GYMLUDRAFT_34093 [Collybiopsis luxurians FD-317 M1]|nr:hypothetical protein GYMLUDRAFT_34093 [Collybiopsis luxurians FD-317 M1]